MELVSAPEGGNGTYDPSYERVVTVFNCAPYGNDVPYPGSVPQGARLQVRRQNSFDVAPSGTGVLPQPGVHSGPQGWAMHVGGTVTRGMCFQAWARMQQLLQCKRLDRPQCTPCPASGLSRVTCPCLASGPVESSLTHCCSLLT